MKKYLVLAQRHKVLRESRYLKLFTSFSKKYINSFREYQKLWARSNDRVVISVTFALREHFGQLGELETLRNVLPGSRSVLTTMLAAFPAGCSSSVKP